MIETTSFRRRPAARAEALPPADALRRLALCLVGAGLVMGSLQVGAILAVDRTPHVAPLQAAGSTR